MGEPQAGGFTASEAASSAYSFSPLVYHIRSGALDRVARSLQVEEIPFVSAGRPYHCPAARWHWGGDLA